MTTRPAPITAPSALRRGLSHSLIALAMAVSCASTALLATPARAGTEDLSAASSLALSLPVAVVASAPALVLSAGVQLTVVAVTASATGTVWVLERASDGARIVLRVSGDAARGASIGAGMAVGVTVLSAGWLLTSGGEALCFVPNERGTALMHHQRLTY